MNSSEVFAWVGLLAAVMNVLGWVELNGVIWLICNLWVLTSERRKRKLST